MEKETLHAHFDGKVAEKELKKHFDKVKTQQLELIEFNDDLECLFRMPEDDKEGCTVYTVYMGEKSFTLFNEDEFQNKVIPNVERLTQTRNLVVSGEFSEDVFDVLENNLDGEIEIVKTLYVFETEEPLLPISERVSSFNRVYTWETENTPGTVTTTAGKNEVKVISDDSDKEAKEKFQNYIKRLNEKEDWPPNINYQSIHKGELDMEQLRENFDVKDTCEAHENSQKESPTVYVTFGNEFVACNPGTGQRGDDILSVSNKSHEQARQNVQKLVKQGVFNESKEPGRLIDYDMDEIMEKS